MFLCTTTGKIDRRRTGKNTKWSRKVLEGSSCIIGVVYPTAIKTVTAIELIINAKDIFSSRIASGKSVGVVIVLPGAKSADIRQRKKVENFLDLRKHRLLCRRKLRRIDLIVRDPRSGDHNRMAVSIDRLRK